MNGVDLLAFEFACIFKSELGDARRSLFGDDLQALHHPGYYFVLDARVEAFRVFANHNQIDIGILRGDSRQVDDRPEVGKQLELLAQRHIDAGEASAHRSGDRSLEPDVRALDRLGQFFGNVLLVFREGLGPGGKTLPFKLYAGGFQDTNACLYNFRPDTIAGNQRNYICHVLS